MVELVNKNQFTLRAGLRPRPPYSRIVMLSMFTDTGNNQTDEVESAVLASSGILLHVHIHVHHSMVQQSAQGAMWLGFNQLGPIESDGGVSFRESIIRVYGTDPDSITMIGADEDYEFDLDVRFVGDKTRLAMAMRTFNTFTTVVQAFFRIAEG